MVEVGILRGACHAPGKTEATESNQLTLTENMKSIFKPKIIYAAILALAGVVACVSRADNQSVSFMAGQGGTGTGCPGTYFGCAKMTNNAGTFWIVPPTNTTSGTFTDASSFGTSYVSTAYVKCNNLQIWCDTNSVTFPATNSRQYQLIVFVKSAVPPPTNGQPMDLQINWK